MIDRRGFVQSLIALGASAGLRPATTVFGAMASDDLKSLADAALATAKQGWRQLRRHPHQPLSQPVHLHPRPPRPEHRQHRGLRLRRPRARGRHLGLREQQRGDQGRDCCDRAAGRGIARANKSVNTDPVQLAPVETFATAEWNTPVKKDPFELPLQPKIDLLLQINEEALKVQGASFVSAFMLFVNEKKFFASTDGSYITQSLIRSWPTFNITSVDRSTNRFYQRNALTAPDGRRLRVHREPIRCSRRSRSPPKKRWRCTRPSPHLPARRR